MIKPRKLVLYNVCCHAHQTLDYKPGITGVVGKNGAGKSNLVTTAQYFAITGKAYGRTKSELLRMGTARGRTEFEFEYGGKILTLTRSVHSATVTLVSTDGEVDLSGADANNFMQDALGADAATLLQTCWCPQGTLQDILLMKDTERLKYFQQLAGVKEAERIRKSLQDRLTALPTYPDRSEEIEALRKQIPELQGQTRESEKEKAQLTTFLAEHEKVYKEQLVIASLPLAEEIGTQLDGKFAELGRLKKKLEEFEKENEALLNLSSSPPPRITEEEIFAQANAREIERLKAELESIRQEAAENPVETPAPKPYADLADDEKALIRELRKKIEAAEAGTCPTCGQQYHGSDPVSLGKAVKDAETRLEEHTRLYHDHLAALRLQERAQETEAGIQRLQEELKPFDLQAIADKKKACEDWDAVQAERLRVVNNRDVILTALQATERDIQIAQANRTASKEDKENALVITNVYETKRNRLEAVKSEIAIAEGHCKILEGNLQKAEQEQQLRNKTEAARKFLSESREAFHTSKAPRLVMSKLLIGVNAKLMNYLGSFDVDFTAHLNEKFQFICRFRNGDVMPSHLLSGGQSIALAVAVNFALSDLLAGNLPITVMDEPTVFLDEGNIESLAQVLEKAKGLLKRGTFIQVATHEEAIKASFTRTKEV